MTEWDGVIEPEPTDVFRHYSRLVVTANLFLSLEFWISPR